MKDDPIINEVRKVREELERPFDFDAKAIFADLRRRQRSLGARLVRPKKSERSQETDSDVTALHPGR